MHRNFFISNTLLKETTLRESFLTNANNFQHISNFLESFFYLHDKIGTQPVNTIIFDVDFKENTILVLSIFLDLPNKVHGKTFHRLRLRTVRSNAQWQLLSLAGRAARILNAMGFAKGFFPIRNYNSQDTTRCFLTDVFT